MQIIIQITSGLSTTHRHTRVCTQTDRHTSNRKKRLQYTKFAGFASLSWKEGKKTAHNLSLVPFFLPSLVYALLRAIAPSTRARSERLAHGHTARRTDGHTHTGIVIYTAASHDAYTNNEETKVKEKTWTGGQTHTENIRILCYW